MKTSVSYGLCFALCSSCNGLVTRPSILARSTSLGTRVVDRRRHSRRLSITCKWVEESVRLDIPASAEEAYSLYSQLEEHPRWSPWLKGVTFDEEKRTSTWALKVLGFSVSWESINTVEIAAEEIAWESRTGLANRGRVRFEDVRPGQCYMTMTLSYDLPKVAAAILKSRAAEAVVQKTLLNDLKRFRKLLTGHELDEGIEEVPVEGDEEYDNMDLDL